MSDQPDTAATAQSWPADCYPTPEQLAEWLTRCTDEERITVCARMIYASERAEPLLRAEP